MALRKGGCRLRNRTERSRSLCRVLSPRRYEEGTRGEGKSAEDAPSVRGRRDAGARYRGRVARSRVLLYFSVFEIPNYKVCIRAYFKCTSYSCMKNVEGEKEGCVTSAVTTSTELATADPHLPNHPIPSRLQLHHPNQPCASPNDEQVPPTLPPAWQHRASPPCTRYLPPPSPLPSPSLSLTFHPFPFPQ